MKYLKKFANNAEYEEYVATEHPTPNVSLAVAENDVHYEPLQPHDYGRDYLTFVAREDGTFRFSGNSINYSLDGGETWVELASDTNSPTVSSGNKIMWKSTLIPTTNKGIGIFVSSAKFDAEGNPMSLLFGDNFKGQTNLSGKDYAFYGLFSGNTNVVSTDNISLIATTLASYCYAHMFYGCTSLTTAPQLPATTLADYCYLSMFLGCTSLTAAPELPATTLAPHCYSGIFYNCTSLTTAPELIATTLAYGCYNSMFYNCTSLTEAPELPATTLANACYYYMFYGCTSLTTAPQLLATTLVYACYSHMFNGCSQLNYIKCLATNISANSCTYNWVQGVSSSGTFVKAASMTSWTEGVAGIPSNWTVQDAS